MLERVKQLREECRGLHAQMTAMLTLASTGNRTLTTEEQTRFDTMDTDYESKAGEADRIERLLARDAQINETRRAPIHEPVTGRIAEGGDAEKIRADQKAAFWKFMRHGIGYLNETERRHIMPLRENASNLPELRDLSVTDAAGGYTIRPEFMPNLETAMKAFGQVRNSATVITTASGDTMTWPTANDTGNVGVILAENTAAAEQDIVFGAMLLDAYKYSSKMIQVSVELMNDSAFNLESWLTERLAERIGRITNTHFTVGTGTAQPNGIVTASVQGRVGTTGQTTSVIYADLVELEHSVDIAYRNQGCAWMMHDSSLKVIKKLVDSQGRPLWSDIASGSPATILGYPYIVNNDVAVMAANAKSILFGKMNKYVVRDVVGITMLVLRERYAEAHQVAFLGFMRTDGDLLDAGTNPVKHYANSAT